MKNKQNNFVVIINLFNIKYSNNLGYIIYKFYNDKNKFRKMCFKF